MIPPRENLLAAFPPSRTAGNVTLRPLTLAGMARLGAEGVDCGAAVPRDKALRAAFILSGGRDDARPSHGDRDWRRFLKRTRCGLQQLLNAVEATLNDAFATYVKPLGKAADQVEAAVAAPRGLGAPLELAEWLCAEYGWSWREALETPVATVYALAAAAHKRNGGKFAGMDYCQRQYAQDVKAGRAKARSPFDSGTEEAV